MFQLKNLFLSLKFWEKYTLHDFISENKTSTEHTDTKQNRPRSDLFSIIAPTGFWPRGQNPRRHYRNPRVIENMYGITEKISNRRGAGAAKDLWVTYMIGWKAAKDLWVTFMIGEAS